MIKDVKRKEVRHQGKDPSARSPFEEREYEQVIEMLEECADVEKRLFTSALFRFQLAMIGRIDDCAKL
jgi:hypothetical protein